MRDFASLQTRPWLMARGAEVLFAFALAPAFAWMNPFFSSKQPFPALVAYWCVLLASWFLMMAAVERGLSGLETVRRLSPGMRRAAVIAIAACPMIAVVGAATHALKGWDATVLEIVELYFQIILVGSGVALIAYAIIVSRSQTESTGRFATSLQPANGPVSGEPSPVIENLHAPSPGTAGRLIHRLPLHLRGTILCLEMEDHYVRVHTDRGSALVLLRLGDAMAEAGHSGQQVHRSWWVSDGAIERFERTGRTGQLHLSVGIKVPVSQRYLKLVESNYGGRRAVAAMTSPNR